MSPSDLEATGLRQLTPEQIETLSAWLDEYRTAAERLARDAAMSQEGVSGDQSTIESRLDGDFDGWVGDTIFRLQNGQVWQQISPSAKYLFVHAPKVTISPAPHTLRVEGLVGEIAVRRLK